jgi:hypothetical protein
MKTIKTLQAAPLLLVLTRWFLAQRTCDSISLRCVKQYDTKCGLEVWRAKCHPFWNVVQPQTDSPQSNNWAPIVSSTIGEKVFILLLAVHGDSDSVATFTSWLLPRAGSAGKHVLKVAVVPLVDFLRANLQHCRVWGVYNIKATPLSDNSGQASTWRSRGIATAKS